MTAISDHYRRLSDAFEATLAGVRPDQWDAPTPCQDWNARQLVEHVANNAGLFFGLIGEAAPDLASATNPAEAWRTSDRAMRQALSDPTVADKEYDGMFGRTTFAKSVDQFMSFDLIVHRWDLARATGQDDRIDPDDVSWAFEQTKNWGDAMRSPKAFGPEINPPSDADDQTRLLAFVGRRS